MIEIEIEIEIGMCTAADAGFITCPGGCFWTDRLWRSQCSGS